MSSLLKSILMIPSGGAASLLEYKKSANIFSDYNLCSNASEKLVTTITSAYNLCTPQEEYLTAIPTSVYDLSTAVT